MKFNIIALLITFLFVGNIRALNITSVNGAGNKKDFEFSKFISVKGIMIDGGFLKMPLDAYKKKRYSNIRILSKDFYDRISDCFEDSGRVEIERAKKEEKKDISLKVEKIFPLKSPLRIANAEISFDEDIIIVFGIVKDKEKKGKFWISYPGHFEIMNDVLKNRLEKLIMSEFKKSIEKDDREKNEIEIIF